MGSYMNEENIYRNPIIYADVPDMDIIRSKDREGRQAFYMVSTTMHLSPGVPIMKSYDLVHWATVNYVYQILEDGDRYCLKNGRMTIPLVHGRQASGRILLQDGIL